MASKPKARGTKKKAAKKPKMEAKEQSDRFIKTARQIEADESGEQFLHAFDTLVLSKGRKAPTDGK